MFAKGGVHVRKDYALGGQIFAETMIDHFRLVLGTHTGEELTFSFGNTKFIERSLDLGWDIVPRLALTIRSTHEIVDVLEVEVVQIPAPLG